MRTNRCQQTPQGRRQTKQGSAYGQRQMTNCGWRPVMQHAASRVGSVDDHCICGRCLVSDEELGCLACRSGGSNVMEHNHADRTKGCPSRRRL
nr:hypothetical protein CFP56_71913 [Quercus suber]